MNPSYRLTDDVLLYASAAAGEKSGSVQFDSADGRPQNVRPERSMNFEVGVKSYLADRKLLLNANLYQTRVQDYQAVTQRRRRDLANGFQLVARQHSRKSARAASSSTARTT